MCLLASLLVWVDAEFLRPNPPLIRGEPAPASREPLRAVGTRLPLH